MDSSFFYEDSIGFLAEKYSLYASEWKHRLTSREWKYKVEMRKGKKIDRKSWRKHEERKERKEGEWGEKVEEEKQRMEV